MGSSTSVATAPAINCNDGGLLYASSVYHDGSAEAAGASHIQPFRGVMVDANTCDVAYQYASSKTPTNFIGVDARRFHYVWNPTTQLWDVKSMDPSRSGVTASYDIPAVLPVLAPQVAATAAPASSTSWMMILFVVVIFAAIIMGVRFVRNRMAAKTGGNEEPEAIDDEPNH